MSSLSPTVAHDCVFTCAINWMILTKIFRGMSLGTTLRDPLGKSVVTMVLSRLQRQRRGRVVREKCLELKSVL